MSEEGNKFSDEDLIARFQNGDEYAFDEIKNAFDSKKIVDYTDIKYNNYKFLFHTKEMQDKVFISGL